MKTRSQINEEHRGDLDVLRRFAAFNLDPFCRAVSSLYDSAIAMVTLIDDATVWVKAHHGVNSELFARDDTFCAETILRETGSALVIHDLRLSELHRDSRFVRFAPHARFYAGVPIALTPGCNIGTLCIIDTVPRSDFGAKQTRELQHLARTIEEHLRLLKARIDSEKNTQHYRLLAENTTDVIIWNDVDSTRRYVSPAAKAVLGYDPEELIGTKPLGFIHPDDAERFAALRERLANGTMRQAVSCLRYRHGQGHWVWIEASFNVTRDLSDGSVDGCVVSLRDVSDRKAIEDELRISEERLAVAVDSGTDGMWDWDVASGGVHHSGRWKALLGYGDDGIEPRLAAWQDLMHPDDRAQAQERLVAHFKGATTRFECEYRVRRNTGDYLWTSARGKVVARNSEGRALRMVGTHVDVTRRKEIERQMAHMAMHDALTGLPNRTVFRDRLEQEMGSAERGAHSFAVIACDLDSFKSVNDTLGHSAGDILLRTIAERLRPVIRDGDLVARLGGDEFAIVMGRLDHRDDASVVARRVIEAIERPIDIDGTLASMSASIGIAIGPGDGQDADQLFKNADIAMYKAKAAGRNTYRFYETGMDAALAEKRRLEQDLRDAVRNGGFALHFQPVVLLATERVIGFEALLRWFHPLRGTVDPSDFIPIAEQTGLIVALGAWALKEACREATRWPDDVRIAVNVSAVQFERPGLEQNVLMALASSGLAADRLELEITESVLMQDAEAVIASLRRLRGLGVRIALDDFGTGYSSLSYLRRFPFNKIKIDRSFIREIDDPDTAAIVRAVVGLAARVGADITAEGVESAAQLSRVREEGCTQVQGYFFGRPLAAEDAWNMITRTAAAA